MYRYVRYCNIITTTSLDLSLSVFFFFNDTATTEIYTLCLHDALPILIEGRVESGPDDLRRPRPRGANGSRSEEHTSELQSQSNLVCRLLLEKKNKQEQSASKSTRQKSIHLVISYTVLR